MNSIVILNSLIVAGVIIAAVMTVVFDKMLSSIIALGIVGSLVALEFIVLDAPDVAIAEAAVGSVLSTVIFIIALRKVKEGKEE